MYHMYHKGVPQRHVSIYNLSYQNMENGLYLMRIKALHIIETIKRLSNI